MKKKKEKLKTILCVIVIMIIFLVLFINTVILINSFKNTKEAPGFMGYKPCIVLSDAMETKINEGDLAIIKKEEPENLKVGDIIGYQSGEIIIIHRIQEIIKTADGNLQFQTKGDNLQDVDEGLISTEKIEGKYLFKIAKLGTVAMFLQTPAGLLISISIPILIIVFVQLSETKKFEKEIEEMKKTKEK